MCVWLRIFPQKCINTGMVSFPKTPSNAVADYSEENLYTLLNDD